MVLVELFVFVVMFGVKIQCSVCLGLLLAGVVWISAQSLGSNSYCSFFMSFLLVHRNICKSEKV